MHTHAQRAVPLDLRLRQWLCAATRGHAFIMGIDGPRMYLICQHCFHETSGWERGEAAASGQVLSGLITMHDAECIRTGPCNRVAACAVRAGGAADPSTHR